MNTINKKEFAQIFNDIINEEIELKKEYEKSEHILPYGEIEEVDEDTRDIIFNIVVKIINCPKQKWVSIAELIDYNPEFEMVDPLMQGKISRYVHSVCKKIAIELIKENRIGGLAYFNKFKKA